MVPLSAARQPRQGMGRPASQCNAHVDHLLQHWLGQLFPECGRSVVLRVAAAGGRPTLPATPRCLALLAQLDGCFAYTQLNVS